MAATNFTPIQLYFSTTASAVPTAANLAQGELAINITDGKVYYEDNSGAVQVIATKGTGTIGGSTTQIQYNNAGALAGSSAMTFNSGTSTTTLTTLNLTNALGATYGGTAQSTYAQGDIVYASAANTLAKLGIGASTFILTSNGTIPQWVAPSSISVLTATNLAGGAAGSVPYQSGVATTTFLAIGAANTVMTSSGTAPQWGTTLTGLTGVSSSSITNTGLTSGRVVFSTTAGLETDSANLTFSGTILTSTGFAGPLNGTVGATTPATGAFTTVTATTAANAANITAINTLTTAQTGNISAVNNASIPINIGVFGSTAGTFGNTSASTAFVSTTASSLAINAQNASGTVNIGVGTTPATVGAFSSTGLAVTGTLSATGTLSGGTSGTAYSFSGSAPATSLTLDASGNLGIGITTPGQKLHVENSFNGSTWTKISNGNSGTGAAAGVLFGTDQGDAGALSQNSSNAAYGAAANAVRLRNLLNAPITFETNNTERARIDSSGNLGVGTTSPTTKLDVNGNIFSGTVGSTQRNITLATTGGSVIIVSHSTVDINGDLYAAFNYNGTQIGSITQSGTTAVLFNVTSDQRLKENIKDATSSSNLIDAIQVRQYDWKSDGSHQRYGFIAQELVTVAPEAVHAPADSDEMMAVDYSKLVPMLVKELQSLRARVAQLESKP
jgi:hypothetical protein